MQTELISHCECLAAFVRSLPDDVRAETLRTFDSPTKFQGAMDAHTSGISSLQSDGDEKVPSEHDNHGEHEQNQTLSPLVRGSEQSVKECDEQSKGQERMPPPISLMAENNNLIRDNRELKTKYLYILRERNDLGCSF
jgi:hypothetical protein